MAIRTTIATHHKWREIIISVVCAGLALWGAYDAFVTIPAQVKTYDEHIEKMDELSDLQKKLPLSEAEIIRYEELQALDDETPVKPNTFDRFVQWMFISCILYVPWAMMQVKKLKAQVYELDDDGNLTLVDGSVWKHDDIARIDMSKWMSKSIAIVEHTDASTHKLDAYYRKNMEHIIGHIGHRFDPDQWNLDGTKITDEAEDDGEFHEELDDHGDGGDGSGDLSHGSEAEADSDAGRTAP